MINSGMMSSKTDEHSTPQDFYDSLDTEFNFRLDPCATEGNKKCPEYYTREENGLRQIWRGPVFMNPPYGRTIGDWVDKAIDTFQKGELVVCLLPSRTDTRWFHKLLDLGQEMRFIKGRLKFGGAKNSAPFPSVVFVLRGKC